MLLGDVKEEGGPEDPFKVGRVQKPGAKSVTEKVTNVNHFDNNKLTSVIAPQLDRKMQVTWSESMSQFAGKERLFEKVLQKANAYEENDLRRANETEAFHQQRKRGTVEEKQNKSNISVSVGNKVVTKPSATSAAASRHHTQETIDTVSILNYYQLSCIEPTCPKYLDCWSTGATRDQNRRDYSS